MKIAGFQAGYKHLARFQQPQPLPAPADGPVTIPDPINPPKPPHDTETVRPRSDLLTEKADTAAKVDQEAEYIHRLVIGYMGFQSRKRQFEIYMNGLTDGTFGYDDDPDALEFYNTLQDIRDQNNAVKAYAAYHENAWKEDEDA